LLLSWLRGGLDIDKALERHKDTIGERWVREERGYYWKLHLPLIYCRYIEVFESRMSILERVKKTRSEGGVRGKDAVREREKGFRGERSWRGEGQGIWE
jgi:hypothetical protein